MGVSPVGSEAPAALPAGASCLPAPRPACMPRAREPHPKPSLDLPQAREEFSSPSYARFLSAVPSSPSLGSDLTKPRVRGAPPPVVSHGSSGRLCSLLPAGGGRPVQPTGLLRSPGPAGGRGQWWSGRGRCGGRGRAPPCGVALSCPSSPGGQPAGPGAPAPCHRPRTLEGALGEGFGEGAHVLAQLLPGGHQQHVHVRPELQVHQGLLHLRPADRRLGASDRWMLWLLCLLGGGLLRPQVSVQPDDS